MSAETGIQWTDSTWNPIRGCSLVSAGCTNCYAMGVAARFSGPGQSYEGLARRRSNGQAQWTGEVRVIEAHMRDPLKWKAPRRIFVNSMSDLFHENVGDETLDEIFGVMALADRHTFQCLTKRPERMRDYFADELRFAMIEGNAQRIYHERTGEDPSMWLAVPGPLPNVWLGVSTENQATADERIPLLLQTPAAVRFLSCEPLLGPVQIPEYLPNALWNDLPSWKSPEIDWVIVGGESGRNARPMNVEWVRSLVGQCQGAHVPVFVKADGTLGRWV